MHIIYSPLFLKHSLGESHPECPARLEVILKSLEADMKYDLVEPSSAQEQDLLLVHSKKHLENLEKLSALQRSFPDNVFSKQTYGIAKLAAGAALDAALMCSKEFSFALTRPPGHHAGKNFFAGFCYLNNIAFAARKMQSLKKAEKVLIIDFDLHHGNGTQDIFRDDPSVFYLSLNQDPSFTYPGSGFESENNSHIRNVVIHEEATENEYIQAFEDSLRESFKQHKPDLIGVSAGFDTYGLDQIGSKIHIFHSSVYNELGAAIRKCKVPTFGVLEGGYYLPALGQNVCEFLKAFE